MKSLTDLELIELMDETVRELEHRVNIGQIANFRISPEFAEGQIYWSESTAQCSNRYVDHQGSEADVSFRPWTSSSMSC